MSEGYYVIDRLHFGPVSTRIITFCLFLGDEVNSELNMKPPVASNGPHLEAILACLLYLVCGRHAPQIRLYPRRLLRQVLGRNKDEWRGVIGINSCSDFKAFHMSINIGLGCQSIFSGDILATMRSKHIYFQVTSIGHFIVNWDRLLAFQLLFLSQSFSQPVSVSGICQFPPSQQRSAQHH